MTYQAQTLGVGASERLINAAVNNPEGLLLVAAGCALLMRTRGPRSAANPGRSYTDDSRRGSDFPSRGAVTEAAETVRQYASDIGDKLTETATSYASSASATVQEAGRSVADTSQRVVTGAQSAVQDTMSRIVHEQPLALALLGLAAGAAVAAILPPSDIERQALGPTAKRLTAVAEKAGDTLKNSTAKVGERVKSAAVEGLQEAASDVADAVGDALSGQPQSQTTAAATSSSTVGKSTSERGLSGSSGVMGGSTPPGGIERGNNNSPGSSSGRSGS